MRMRGYTLKETSQILTQPWMETITQKKFAHNFPK